MPSPADNRTQIPQPKTVNAQSGVGALRVALNFSEADFSSFTLFTRKIAKIHLVADTKYDKQPRHAVKRFVAKVKAKAKFLDKYVDDWPLHVYMRRHLSTTINTKKSESNAKARQQSLDVDDGLGVRKQRLWRLVSPDPNAQPGSRSRITRRSTTSDLYENPTDDDDIDSSSPRFPDTSSVGQQKLPASVKGAGQQARRGRRSSSSDNSAPAKKVRLVSEHPSSGSRLARRTEIASSEAPEEVAQLVRERQAALFEQLARKRQTEPVEQRIREGQGEHVEQRVREPRAGQIVQRVQADESANNEPFVPVMLKRIKVGEAVRAAFNAPRGEMALAFLKVYRLEHLMDVFRQNDIARDARFLRLLEWSPGSSPDFINEIAGRGQLTRSEAFEIKRGLQEAMYLLDDSHGLTPDGT